MSHRLLHLQNENDPLLDSANFALTYISAGLTLQQLIRKMIRLRTVDMFSTVPKSSFTNLSRYSLYRKIHDADESY